MNLESYLDNKTNFAFLPTPIHKLNNLTERLGGANIYIKRDDMTGLALGGNKARKLEYLIKEAIDGEFNAVITSGSLQSNHVRQTIAACALYRLECHAVLVGQGDNKEGNLLLDYLLGGHIYIVDSDKHVQTKVQEIQSLLSIEGKKVYVIPAGGSNPTGMLGYINAFREILNDEKKLGVSFDYIVFASSSLGTHGGLIAGNHYFNEGKKKIYGISVCKNFLDSSSGVSDEDKLVNLMEQFNLKYGANVKLNKEDIIYDQRFNSQGYAVLGDEDKNAISVFAKEEAIILDPVYTARAAAGLMNLISTGEIPKDSNVLFIHTGGSPALFTNLFNY
jgi:D-cysteine desulfhydrase family pyridoxal phosphate-dependent enzyme